MKKINQIISICMLLILFSNCSNDGYSDENTPENYVTDLCPPNIGTCCGLSGRFKVIPNKTYTYTSNTSILNPTISWEVLDGSITLVSTNGNTAKFKFNSNFTSGKISCTAENPTYGLCEVRLDIFKL
ncbi:hypothetical protein [Flavobacterium sp.]|uniref:hypothetical protein n=1 Tax=Flavobacterium sp. TaxID=239 RepID=UPI00286CD3C9|nr:hypothetical protein [Flavobacterium sp.]